MPDDSHLSLVYLVYALVSIGLTVWLARTLSKNGRIFLEEVFPAQPALATAVNQLLVVGFYLVNFGYACLLLEGGNAYTVREAIETLAGKLGALLLSLAVMHFLNVFVFHRIRRRARRAAEAAPLPHHGVVAPAPIYSEPMHAHS